MMPRIDPVTCTYCGSVSQWSSERTERTELSETYECSSCGESTAVWDDTEVKRLDGGVRMPWVGPDPLY